MPNPNELYEILKSEFSNGIYLLETKLNNSKYEIIKDPLYINSQIHSNVLFIYDRKKSETLDFGTWDLTREDLIVFLTINDIKYIIMNYVDEKKLILIDNKKERRIFEKYDISIAEYNL